MADDDLDITQPVPTYDSDAVDRKAAAQRKQGRKRTYKLDLDIETPYDRNKPQGRQSDRIYRQAFRDYLVKNPDNREGAFRAAGAIADASIGRRVGRRSTRR